MDSILDIMKAVAGIINEMSPYLLLGFLLAGVMHAFIPGGWYAKYLSGHSLRSVINAALFGVPLPLCSCGVIPTAMSLRREGAGKGAVTSFLIATPQTGVDSIIATYSLIGLPFAIVRPIAAFFTAIIGGSLVNWGERKRDNGHPDLLPVSPYNNNRRENIPNHSVGSRILSVLRYGFIEMMEDIGKWLVVGLIVAGLITVLVPDNVFAIFKDNTLLSILLVLCISIPMYICATGSIPIAVALMIKGLTPGAALVMLMAGPACNVASVLVVNKVMGRRTLLLYLAAIIGGAVLSGIAIDQLLPREWFIGHLSDTHACCHDTAGWFEWLCTGILALLLLNVLRRKLSKRRCCSCESEATHACCHDLAHTSRIYSVKGMTCNHCRSNTERAILSVKGVKAATVDLKSGIAIVSGTGFDDAEIKKAVESLGFTIDINTATEKGE